MPESTAKSHPHHPDPASAGRALLAVARRIYAFVLIAIIVWLTFLAVRYLVRSLVKSAPPPLQITQLPTRLTEGVLRTRRQAWSGVEAAEHPRSPLAHYHRIDAWIQPDRFDDCTRSGCHEPLPHSKRKEVRAFLNMHATSIHCGVCHVQSSSSPLDLTWYDLNRGKARAAPAMFAAYAFTLRQWFVPPGPREQAELVKLLRTAAQEADGAVVFSHLADQVAAVRAGSPALQETLKAVRDTLAQHFRGEYGAKLALRDAPSGQPVLAHPGTADAVREYLKRGASLSGSERDALLAKVHPSKRDEALHCTSCHQPEAGLVDFTKLGYPDARRQALFRPLIFQMIEHIAAGQPMYMPHFVTPGGPASQAGPPPALPPASHPAGAQPGTPRP